jgi:hypothetical protein
MSASRTAHSLIVALLRAKVDPLWSAVYPTHEKADLAVPSLSVEVETDIPMENQGAINQQELQDNRLTQLTVRVHMNYRLGPVDTDGASQIADSVIRWLRENIELGDGFRVFEVAGSVYNVEHTSSGTTGAEITVNIHKVEFYEQT